ncbi:UNVERIFIED_CONTAM: hypothetical protein Sradi_2347100 [Sesamum radiatum]|uniref:Reverse transcriptase domain-containing protein n=1 Tax=Sesamum radiatum TaxID=300843 RepID=A0AAW2T7A0_SESRA
MPRSFTATSITLIPTVESPQSWSDSRPITLQCHKQDHIQTALQKIAQELPNLISSSQSGFVPGRIIADNIPLAQEMTHHLDLRSSKGNLIIKLDMSKAYDGVN